MVKKNSFKYFISYNDDDTIIPLWINLLKMIGYVWNFDGKRTMPFKISDNKLLKKVQSNMEKSWKIIENNIW